MKLTEKIVAELFLPAGKPEYVVSDGDTTGLYFRLRRGAKGKIKRTWFFRYSGGKSSVDYPAYNLTAARKWAGQLQAKVRLGGDPAQERREAQVKSLATMGATLPAYLDHKRQMLRPRSFEEVERHLTKHYQPLHRHPLAALTVALVASCDAAIAAERGGAAARNAGRSLHAFLTWCFKRGLVDRNPAAGLEHRSPRRRDRVLAADEIGALWRATTTPGDFHAILRLLLLTGCRASEIAGLRWSEVYSDRLVIPGERIKNHRQLVVPLTVTARAILDQQPRLGACVFGRRGRGFAGFGSCKRRLDQRLGIEPWVVHDLRRSFCTGCHELGVEPHVVEAAVGHAIGGVAAHYVWARYETPIRRALETWERHVLAIAEGKVAGDRVVPLARVS
jgi:integrase